MKATSTQFETTKHVKITLHFLNNFLYDVGCSTKANIPKFVYGSC